MAISARAAEQLSRIAAALGVPVETFTAQIAQPASDPAPAVHVATLVFDPDGRRFAAAFVDLPPLTRKAFADIAEVCRDTPSVAAGPTRPDDRR